MWEENGTLIALFALVFIILGAFWWFNRQGHELGPALPTTTSPIPSNQIDEIAIRGALIKNYNKPQDDLDCAVLDISGRYARGMATFKNDDRVWLWLAYEDNDDNWQLVHDGQGLAGCRQLKEINFPNQLANECWDKEIERLVTR